MINLQKYSTNKLSKFPGFVAFQTLQKVMDCIENEHIKCSAHVSRVPHIFARLHCWISKASSIEDILGLDYACIYAHLDDRSKRRSADKMEQAFRISPGISATV